MARKKRTPEENARREKIRELLRRLTPRSRQDLIMYNNLRKLKRA